MMASPSAVAAESRVMDTLEAGLRDAVVYFQKGALVSTAGPDQPVRQQPLTVADTTELLDLYVGLLAAAATEDAKTAILRRSISEPMFSTLVAYVSQPLLYAPDAAAGYSLQQTFANLRVATVQLINRLVLFAATHSPEMSQQLAKAVQDQRYCEALVQLLSSPATFETLRTVAAESLFVYVYRIEAGRSHLQAVAAPQAILNCLVLEPAVMVRNFLASSVRELATTHAAALADTNAVEVLTKLMTLDESPDVRALAAEAFDHVLRSNGAAVVTTAVLSRPHDLIGAAKDRLAKDTHPQVVEAVARLVETMCVLATTKYLNVTGTFYDTAVRQHLERALALALEHGIAVANQNQQPPAAPSGPQAYYSGQMPNEVQPQPIAKFPPSTTAAIARALRCLIQYCPAELQVGHHLVTHFQSLSTLLKLAMDLTNPTGESASEHQQVLCVEIGITVSMLLAQSPVHRSQVVKELHSFPLWAQTLRNGLVAFLNMAALEYYAGITLVDVTGTELNSLAGVEWSDQDKPKKAAVRDMFIKQEERVAEQRTARTLLSPPPASEVEARRRQRLTFVVLVYAVHLGLGEPADGNEPGAPQLDPSIDVSAVPAAQTPRGAFPDPYDATSPSVGRRTNAADLPRFPGPRTPRQAMANSTAGAMSPGAAAATPVEILSRTNITAREREEVAFAYDRFDSGFKLIVELSDHYGKKKERRAQFATTPDGFVVRQGNLKNPWGKMVKKDNMKSWGVQDLKEGDVFYFSLPYDELSAGNLKIIIEKAKRHAQVIKRMMVTTPQNAKGRRWFLHDMHTNIVPRVLFLLDELHQLTIEHGSDNLRFPLFMFREKEMHLGERAIHPANLVQILDQLKFFLRQNPNELLGVSAEYVEQMKNQVNRLKGRRFTGDEELPSDHSDDDGVAYGHGGISSESDGE